jgi:hypothetical protein
VNVIAVDINVGKVLLAQGKLDAGIRLLQNVNGVVERLEHKNRYELADLAESDSSLGQGYLSLAEQNGTANSKVEHLREARSWYQKSVALWKEMPSAGSANARNDVETIESLSRQVAKCDAAFAKLNADHQTSSAPASSGSDKSPRASAAPK